MTHPGIPPLTHVLVALSLGVLYREDNERLWNDLLRHTIGARDHYAAMGLSVVIDDAEGYAYLTGINYDDDIPDAPKRLVPRSRLGFQVSLLLALLRKKLAEFDSAGGSAVLVMTRDDVVEMVRVFLPATGNEVALVVKIDAYITRAVELGFLKPVPGADASWRVQRILKAFVDAQWLADLDSRLGAWVGKGPSGW
jgi:hypothetical protein